MTKLKPLADRVVVKLIDETEQTSGGIFIPDSAREKPQKGEVIAVGAGAYGKDDKRQELEVKVGDVVIFAKYGGTEMKIDGQDLKILAERDILAIVE